MNYLVFILFFSFLNLAAADAIIEEPKIQSEWGSYVLLPSIGVMLSGIDYTELKVLRAQVNNGILKYGALFYCGCQVALGYNASSEVIKEKCGRSAEFHFSKGFKDLKRLGMFFERQEKYYMKPEIYSALKFLGVFDDFSGRLMSMRNFKITEVIECKHSEDHGYDYHLKISPVE